MYDNNIYNLRILFFCMPHESWKMIRQNDVGIARSGLNWQMLGSIPATGTHFFL